MPRSRAAQLAIACDWPQEIRQILEALLRPEAVTSLNQWPTGGVACYTSGQILREYLVVVTRPAADNGSE